VVLNFVYKIEKLLILRDKKLVNIEMKNKINGATSVLTDCNLFQHIISFLGMKIPSININDYRIYLLQSKYILELKISSFVKNLIYMWINFDFFKMHYNERLYWIKEYYSIYNEKKDKRIYYTHRKQNENGTFRQINYSESDLSNFFQYSDLNDMKNYNEIFPITPKSINSMFPVLIEEIFPNSLKLYNYEINFDKFELTFGMKGLGYSGILSNCEEHTLNILLTIIGNKVNHFENKFQIKFNNQLYSLNIKWKKEIISSKFTFHDFYREPFLA
jgi:hypothetical protein